METGVMKASEVLFVVGFFCAALGAGLCQFVMIGLVGVGLFPLAFLLLLLAGILAQTAGNVSLSRQGEGLAVYLVGISLLLTLAGYATSLAFDSSTRILEWGLLALLSLAPMIVISLGLRFRTAWSWRRCVLWGVVAWCVLPASLMVFWILAPVLPLTA
jgi:hypothetical protein